MFRPSTLTVICSIKVRARLSLNLTPVGRVRSNVNLAVPGVITSFEPNVGNLTCRSSLGLTDDGLFVRRTTCLIPLKVLCLL